MNDEPRCGSPKDQIDTPALCLDLDIMQSNIQQMADVCRSNRIDWRPHAKCHKSSRIAKMLVSAGAIGVTCAKLGEAEVFAGAGVRDLLIANMVVGRQKLDRLAALTRISDPIVCLDHAQQAIDISRAMSANDTTTRAVIEVDIGLQRVGVQPGQATWELTRQVLDLPGIRFAGLMAYEGHLLRIPDVREKETAIRAAIGIALETKTLLEANGVACPIFSCGGTGSYQHTVRIPGITELQAGGAIFMDAFYRDACQVSELGFALTVLTTVVSRPTSDRVIVDAGRKSLDMQIHPPQVLGRSDLRVNNLSAEHGILEQHQDGPEVRIGDRLELIPGYADLTINLHDHFVACRGGRVVEILPVEARGRVR